MSKMEIKVGDTFRVFEVVNFPDHSCPIGCTGIEVAFLNGDSCPHLVKINTEDRECWFESSELKQVGTIRIKHLKDARA